MYAESRLEGKLDRPAAAGGGGAIDSPAGREAAGASFRRYFFFITKSGQIKQTEAEHVEILLNQRNSLAPLRGSALIVLHTVLHTELLHTKTGLFRMAMERKNSIQCQLGLVDRFKYQ